MRRPLPELLAPAGTPEALETAFHFGADAVYLGLKQGSLRRHARNFTWDELAGALAYAHDRGRRVYVALNVQAFDADLPALGAQLRRLAELRPDGLIVADAGVIELARQQAPAVPLHLSTQGSVTNAAAARFWFAQGVRRIVVARELSVEQLRALVAAVPPRCEIEAFVHGAVCVAYSGRCLLSLYWSGRDGRDGRPARDARVGSCAQGCRWPYARMAVEDRRRPGQWNPIEQDARGTHFFDAKDLCALPLLPSLLSTGVHALKIEGRTRSPHYVGVVVDVYRRALDQIAAGNVAAFEADLPEYLAELGRVPNRGYSTHFLGGTQDDPQSYNPGGSFPDGRHRFIGVVESVDASGLWVRCRNAVSAGERLELRDRGGLREPVILTRIDTDAEQDLPRALHGDRIRIPGRFRSGPGALLRRADGAGEPVDAPPR